MRYERSKIEWNPDRSEPFAVFGGDLWLQSQGIHSYGCDFRLMAASGLAARNRPGSMRLVSILRELSTPNENRARNAN